MLGLVIHLPGPPKDTFIIYSITTSLMAILDTKFLVSSGKGSVAICAAKTLQWYRGQEENAHWCTQVDTIYIV